MVAISLTEKSCRICAAAYGSTASAEYDRPWLQSPDYLAFASIGALVPGWSLVFPKNHYLNLARDFTTDAFWSFARRAHEVVEAQFGRAVVFEHGAQHENSATGCGTDHAHMHIVPLTFSLVDAAKDFDHSIIWRRCKASEVNDTAEGNEYLFVSDTFNGAETEGQIAVLQTGRSQFFRRVIASKLGCPVEFDYKFHRFESTAVATARTLRATAQGTRAAAA
ncbi:HIT family protein [Xanthomonas sp. NCPPB 2632]|uniref:HIT family protein n=1 Tax=Xanthomonas sp. NCPPB 2632 TaxID=3240912 RepID=UPI0035158ED9